MYEIKEDVLKATIQYLASKPFAEVAQLINALQQSKKILPPEEEVKLKE